MDRMTCNIFLVLGVVYFSLAENGFCHSDITNYSSDGKPCPENCRIRDNIPAYIYGLLGFVSILLLLVSILLIYIVVKTQFLHTLNIWNKNTNTQTPEKVEDGCTQSQPCQKKTAGATTLDKTINESKNEKENNQTLKRQDSVVTIASEYNTLRSPKKTEASGNISPRIIKGAAKDMPIILPEQMSLICKAVLKRAAKNGSTNSLQNIDQLVMEAKPVEESISKCASTSALDIYDTLKTPSCDEKNKAQKDDAINKKSKTVSINSVDDKSESDCDVYDCPKAQDITQDSIYDLPKESTAKVDNQSGYITPYFSANRPLSGILRGKEEKPNYAQVNALSAKEFPIQNEVKNTEKKDNEANERTDLKECEYEFPKKCSKDSKDQMYINANDVPTNDVQEK